MKKQGYKLSLQIREYTSTQNKAYWSLETRAFVQGRKYCMYVQAVTSRG